jgi:CCR4-NOT transcription complex subunit 3
VRFQVVVSGECARDADFTAEMKTKAFSKEGLSAAAKLDPKEREKMEISNFVSDMVDELGRQTEAYEAEIETVQAGMKKGKKDTGKADRMSELERNVEKHKEHMSKLEIILRGVENGSIEVEQVKDIQEDIKHYVENNQEVDFEENEYMYEGLNLEEEEDMWGMNKEDGDRVSSQDAHSIADDAPDHTDGPPAPVKPSGAGKGKSQSISEPQPAGRRSSQQHAKSPLPALSSLHQSLPNNASHKVAAAAEMKPAPLPTIPTGQPLKYASAAAAAAASDKNGVGIAPLPPPPGAQQKPASEQNSPAVVNAQPVETIQQSVKAAETLPKQPTPAPKEETPKSDPVTQASSKVSSVKPSPQAAQAQPAPTATESSSTSTVKVPQPPSPDSGIAGLALSNGTAAPAEEDEEVGSEEEEESYYHLPSSLTDLLDSFEETKKRATSDQPFDVSLLNASRLHAPKPSDAAKPSHYAPQTPYPYTPSHYPTTPLPIFDDPRLYSRIDTDSLFYAFYYRQGTYQQYLAAKALKSQSWRFHKQYQTWFQRHEEPKNITEEFEQGTYRFFDYESTW